MARTTIFVAFNNAALLRASSRAGTRRHYISRYAATRAVEHEETETETETETEHNKRSCKGAVAMNWVPHPRNGIYFPEGQERVMNDVPCDAATLGQGQTYWLRNIDGVDKHDPDISSANQYLLTSPVQEIIHI